MKTGLLFLLAGFTALAGELELKLYSVHFMNAREAADIISMMSPDQAGLNVEVIGDKLAVRGNEEQHRLVRSILTEIDHVPKNIRIHVQISRTGSSTGWEAGVRPRGPVIIRQDGVDATLEARFGSRSASSEENTTQILAVMDGGNATLRVGESVPHLAWLTEYGCRHGYIRDVGIEWRDVGSFLTVTPEILGDGSAIRIRLTPELSGRLQDGTEQTIRFTGASTVVIVRNGQSLSIGGFSENKEFYSKFLIGRSGGQNSAVTDIMLTPHILDPSGNGK